MLKFGSLQVHIMHLKFARKYGCYSHYSDTMTEDGEGCCHTAAYMAIIDKAQVPKVQPGG
jgi:hypothetical protein